MEQDKSTLIVDKMYDNDAFSKWLGIKRIHVSPGECVLEMTVRDEMTNGFGIAHGGICYSLADSALAFAANSHGRKSISVETSISHTVQLKPGDVIRAVAKELNRSNKIGIYEVKISNHTGSLVALFKGTVYITSRDWEV